MSSNDEFIKMLMSRTAALSPVSMHFTTPGFSITENPIAQQWIKRLPYDGENDSVDDAVKFGVAATRIWLDEAATIPPEVIEKLALQREKVSFEALFGLNATNANTSPANRISFDDLMETIRQARAKIACLPKEFVLAESELYCDERSFLRIEGNHVIFIVGSRAQWVSYCAGDDDDMTGTQPLSYLGNTIEAIDWADDLPDDIAQRRAGFRTRLAAALRERLDNSAPLTEQQG